MSLKLLILLLALSTPFVGLVLTWFVEYKKLDELESYFSENHAVERYYRFFYVAKTPYEAWRRDRARVGVGTPGSQAMGDLAVLLRSALAFVFLYLGYLEEMENSYFFLEITVHAYSNYPTFHPR